MKFCVLFIISSLLVTLIAAQPPQLPESLRIGAIFDEGHDSQETAFHHAVDMIHADRSLLVRTRLIAHIERIPRGDSFKATKKVCQMSMPGLTAIVGPSSPSAASHVQGMANQMHLPHIETRFDYSDHSTPYSINVHPHPAVLGKAYADLVRTLGWKSFVILFQTEDSLVKLQELIKVPQNFEDVKMTLRQLDLTTDDYRPLLKEIKKSGETRIVLDCDFDKVQDILRQADEIGLINDYHAYIITNLDVERLDLSDLKFNNVNITGLRLVDTANPDVAEYVKSWTSTYGHGKGPAHPLFSANALTVDAVALYANAMNDLGNVESLQMEQLNCRQGAPWTGGESFLRYLKGAEYHGLTGDIQLDMNGQRTWFKLDLIEKLRDNMVKTGTWTPDAGVNYTRTSEEVDAVVVEQLQNKTLRVTVAINNPFIIRKSLDVPAEALERLSFEEKFEGYVVDLVKELAKAVKFKYKFHLVADGNYGGLNPATGMWNGMIGELIAQQADMAVMDLSMTSSRQAAVDFTMPYMTTGVGILYKKRAPPPPNLFSFLSPLSLDVWIYMTTAYLAVSVLMFLLARITPYEWDNPHPCKTEPDELETQFTLSNSLWFGIGSILCQGSDILPKLSPFEWENPTPWTESDEIEYDCTLHNCFWHNWGSLMQQGSDICPRAISTRMVAGMWWFFTLIMISSYTANLAAFLTAAKMDVPINNAEDLAKQTKIKYGTYCCGSTNAFFRGSTIPTYQKINAFMESAKPSVYTSGNAEGIDRVRKEDGAYAFFMEAASIEYHIERKCDLMQLGGLLDSKGYGVALPPNSPYTRAVSAGVLSLQEKGILQKLKTKWWKEMHGGGNCVGKGSENSAQLGLPNLGGVFIVLTGGMIFSCLFAVVEFMWEKRQMLNDPTGPSIWAECWKEFKFAVDIRAGDTKPVEKEEESDSSSSSSSDSKSDDHYGVITEPDSPHSGKKAKSDSAYAVFTEPNGKKH